jgi:tetratricopeptide (TPR) repeat protein/O-antigen ligase
MIKKIIIFLTPFLIVLSSLHYGSPFIIDKLFIVAGIFIIFVILFYSSLMQEHTGIPRSKLYIPVILFIAYIVLQTIITGTNNQRYTVESLFLSSLIILFLILFYACFDKRENSLYLIQSVLYTNGALVLIYLIIAFGHFKKGEHVFSGWLVNHNHMAMLTGMLMPYAIALSVYRHQKILERIIWFVTLFVLLIGFLFSVSRGGYISLILALSITVLTSAWIGLYSKKLAISLFLVSVIVGIFIINLYPFEHRIFSNLFILSASQRLGIWYGSLKMFLHHPVIGYGIGTYEDAFHMFRPSDILYLVNHAHNVFIETADETGIIGFGLLLWIIIAWIYTLIKTMKHASSNLKKAVLWAGLTSTLFLIFHNFVDFGILVPSNAISAMLLFAGTLSITKVNGDELPPDYIIKLSKLQRVAIGTIGTIIFVIVITFCSRIIYGEFLYNKGKIALEHEDLEQAIKLFTSAQRFIHTDRVFFETGDAWFRLFNRSDSIEALDKAITQLKEAERLCRWNPYYPEDIGGLYQYKGDLSKSIMYTEKALALDPSNASLCLRIADLELENNNLEKAVSYYKKACDIYPPYTWNALSKLIVYNVDTEQLKQIAKLLPDGQWVLANELINTPSVSLGTTVPDVTELKQTIEMQKHSTHNMVAAASILKELMLKEPDNLQRYIPLFISIMPDKKEALNQLQSMHLSDTTMLFYIAMLQAQVNDTDSAIKTLSYIIDNNNTYKPAYQLLSSIYASKNRLEDAIDVLKRGIYYVPSDYALYAMLGALYNQENDWYNAIESYKMAILFNPDYENGYVQMAMIYKAQGMYTQALNIAKQGMDVIPQSKQLKQTIEELTQKMYLQK